MHSFSFSAISSYLFSNSSSSVRQPSSSISSTFMPFVVGVWHMGPVRMFPKKFRHSVNTVSRFTGRGQTIKIVVIGVVHRHDAIELLEIPQPHLPGPVRQQIPPGIGRIPHAGIGLFAGVSGIGSGGIRLQLLPQPPFFDHLPEDAFGRRRAADISEANEQYLILITHNQQIIITKKSAHRHFTIDTLNNCAKIRLSRVQKQILFAFCRGEVFTCITEIRKACDLFAGFYLLYLSSATLTSNTPDKMLLFRRTGLSPSCRKGRYDWHRVR